jgi:hypothetical protein
MSHDHIRTSCFSVYNIRYSTLTTSKWNSPITVLDQRHRILDRAVYIVISIKHCWQAQNKPGSKWRGFVVLLWLWGYHAPMTHRFFWSIKTHCIPMYTECMATEYISVQYTCTLMTSFIWECVRDALISTYFRLDLLVTIIFKMVLMVVCFRIINDCSS